MKLSALDRAIQNLDEKIAALQLARQHLTEQQVKKPKAVKPSRALPGSRLAEAANT